MKYLDILASYVPSLVVSHLLDDLEGPVPTREAFRTVCLFCDVSGFTKLSEAMAQSGRGAEGLKTHLNSYFSQMNKIISGNGGDIFKFAGDAMIVLWPPSDDLGDLARRGAVRDRDPALDQSHAEVAAFSAGPAPADGRGAPPGKAAQVNLSVKIGVGVGDVAVLRRGRRPCASAEARYAKTRCQGIAAFTEDRLSSASTDPKTEAALEVRLERYIPRSVLAALQRDSRECEKWANEITSCVVVFVNLGISEAMLNGAADARSDPDGSRLRFLHDAFGAAQKAVYEYEGSVNKFLHDDKGSTLIACWGLPPTTHVDDPVRAVLAALRLCELLADLKLVASVGITVGDVFCGVTGSVKRREYTCLGDSVNLAARLMQKAGTLVAGGDENAPCGGVLVDAKLGTAWARCSDVAAGRAPPSPAASGAGDDSGDGDAVDLLDDEGYDMGQLVAREPAFARRSRLLWRRLEGEEFLDDDRDHAVVRYAGEAAPSRLVVECAEGGALLGFGGDAAADCLAFDLDGCERPTMRDLRDRARRPSRRACCRPRGPSPAATRLRKAALRAVAFRTPRRSASEDPKRGLSRGAREASFFKGALTRHGRVVVVEAESGCGKSAQVSAFAALASPRTAVVCFCAAKPFGETTPLGPFVAVAAHYVGVVAARACGGRHVACRALLGRPELDDDGAWDAVWKSNLQPNFNHLDVASWKLAALWRSEALPGLLVLATRPLVCLPPWRARERAAAACLLGDDDASGEADEVARRDGGAAPAAPTTIRLDGLPPEDMECSRALRGAVFEYSRGIPGLAADVLDELVHGPDHDARFSRRDAGLPPRRRPNAAAPKRSSATGKRSLAAAPAKDGVVDARRARAWLPPRPGEPSLEVVELNGSTLVRGPSVPGGQRLDDLRPRGGPHPGCRLARARLRTSAGPRCASRRRRGRGARRATAGARPAQGSKGSDAGDDGAAKKRPSSSVVAVVDRFPLANTSRQSLTEKLNGLDVTALIVAKTGAGRGRDAPNVKTAALVGHAFSLPFLKDCAPPSLGGEALEDAVGDLVALGLLEVLYAVAHGPAMRRTVARRMLRCGKVSSALARVAWTCEALSAPSPREQGDDDAAGGGVFSGAFVRATGASR
ncbi:adenylate cyclase [Aureococcus anophagefferens]|nr:adenylate cyclase [Aureococcus anophagefferens]